jgi:hypothetical protein
MTEKLTEKQLKLIDVVKEMVEKFDVNTYVSSVRAFKQYRDLMEVLDGMTVGEFRKLFPSDEKIDLDDNIKINVIGDTLEIALSYKGNPTWDKVCICVETLMLKVTHRPQELGDIMTNDIITRSIIDALDITELDIDGKIYSTSEIIKKGSGEDAYFYIYYAVDDFIYDNDLMKYIKNNSEVFDLQGFARRLISELYVEHRDVLKKKYAITLAAYVKELHEMILLGYYYLVGGNR